MTTDCTGFDAGTAVAITDGTVTIAPNLVCLSGVCTGSSWANFAPSSGSVSTMVMGCYDGTVAGGVEMLCGTVVGSSGSFTGAMTYTPVYLAANPIPATATWPVTPAATAKSGKTGTAKGGKKGHRERRDPGHTTAYDNTGTASLSFPGMTASISFTCAGCPDGTYPAYVSPDHMVLLLTHLHFFALFCGHLGVGLSGSSHLPHPTASAATG
jgi:hypothetical protein